MIAVQFSLTERLVQLRHRAVTTPPAVGLVIHPGELIIGGGDAPISEALGAEIAQLWPGETAPPPELTDLTARGFTILCGNHAVLNYRRALAEGFGGLIERIAAAAADAAPEQQTLYRIWGAIAAGYVAWIARHAEAARQLAAVTAEPGRRGELEQIAADCAHLASAPPTTFRQACQFLYFIYLCAPDSPGRIDQYLIDFYRRDLAAGRITAAEARELLGCLWIKYYEFWGDHPRGGITHLALGGVTADGSDGVNAISGFCLDVAEALQLIRPQIAIRWHRGMARDFLERAVRLLHWNFGSPDFCSDAAIIPALEALGITTADARDYCPSGCHEIMISGRSNMGSLMGEFNLPLLLRCALGLDAMPSGRRLPRTGIDSYQTLWTRWCEACDELAAAIHRISYQIDAERAATAWGLAGSLFTDDCIERGRTLAQGGAVYNFCNWDAIGIADVTDALATIRTLVFEQKTVTLDEFCRALDTDWQDAAALRQRIQTQTDFFGNGCAHTDAIAAAVIRACVAAFAPHTPYRGGRYTLGTLAGYENAHAVFGEKTGATPDGRRAGTPFAATLGAVPGRNSAGITAMLHSVAAMPSECLPTSTTVNVNFEPALLNTAAGVARVAALIEAHFSDGGIELQPTVIDRELLLAAQQHPADYPEVVVRVAGYSAKFATLEANVQDEIIARWNHA